MSSGRFIRGLSLVASLVALSVPLSSCSPGGGSHPGATATGTENQTSTQHVEGAVKDLVDKDLVLTDYLDLNDKPFRLNADGTVSGPDETLLLMSKAKRWRFQDGTLDLCTSEACENWSSWTISEGESGARGNGKAYLLTLKGAETAEGKPVTRNISAAG